MDIAQLFSHINNLEKLELPPRFFENIVEFKSPLQYNQEASRDWIKNMNNAGIQRYPDGSQFFNDLITIVCYINASTKPILTLLYNSLLNQEAASSQVSFESGAITPLHTHNYSELIYIAEGKLHQKIEDREIVFNQGEICLIDKDTPHGEYLYQENMIAFFLCINNRFFDEAMPLAAANDRIKQFLRDMIVSRKEKYQFVRFVPQKTNAEIPALFEYILLELLHPRPGGPHIILGLAERILNLLPENYEVIIKQNNRHIHQKHLFEEVQRYLEMHYQDVCIEKLIRTFGHNIDYFNRLIKRHTGMTYSRFLQNIRLEKSYFLLKTTSMMVEDIAQKVGYENTGYFYKIFFEKYHKKPNEIRKNKAAQSSSP